MKRTFEIVTKGNPWDGTEKYLLIPTWENGQVDSENITAWRSYVYAAIAKEARQKEENLSYVC